MTMDLHEFARTAARIRERARAEGRLTENPDEVTLRGMLERQPGARVTAYGNYVAESEPTSRAASFTKNSVDSQFGEEEVRLLLQCEDSCRPCDSCRSTVWLATRIAAPRYV